MNKLSFGHISVVSVVREWGEKGFSAHSLFSRLISVRDAWHFGYHWFLLAAVFLEQHHPTLTECPQKVIKGEGR